MDNGRRRALITVHAFMRGYSVTPATNADGCWREIEMALDTLIFKPNKQIGDNHDS